MNLPLPPTRRERVRAATVEEIHQVARRLLVDQTITGVTLRAIAREMGMTAAALYRYFPSLESLMASLCAQFYDECREAIEDARDETRPDTGARMYAMCRAFRSWSIAHPAEFNLMFASPVTELKRGHEELATIEDPWSARAHGAGFEFALTFAAIFAELWQRAPFEVPADDEMDPALAEQLRTFLAELTAAQPEGASLPLGAAQLFLSCWIRMYGTVALEVYGHLHFALSDVGPMFEAEIDAAARLLGVDPVEARRA